MSDLHGDLAVLEPDGELLEFEAIDVTGTRTVHVSDVDRRTAVGVVSKALAARMSLPETMPFSLFNGQGAVLEDDKPIAEQIKPGETVSLVPRAHLGAGVK